jgi:PII-like signaling protein
VTGPSFRPAKRLTVYLAGHDRMRHHSMLVAVLRVARSCSVAGFTVFQGSEGFGSSGRAHRTGAFRADAPLTVVVVDTAEQVERLVARLRTDLGEGFGGLVVTVAEVEVLDPGPRGQE